MSNVIGNNVVELNRENIVYYYIQLFLKKKRNNSELTYEAYTTDISQFFMDVFNVPLEFVNEDIIRQCTAIKVQSYFQQMIDERNLSSATIARKTTSLRELFTNICQDDLKDTNGNSLMMKNPLATFKVRVESNEYGAFTKQEVLDIIKVANDDNPELALFYALLFQTGIRSTACRNLTLSNIRKDGRLYIVKTKDKHHNEYEVAIEKGLYDKCVELSDAEGVFFHFSKNAPLNKLACRTTYNKVNGNIKTNYKQSYCYKIGLKEEDVIKRNLTIHSLKKALGTESCNQNANVGELVKILHHKSVKTVTKYIDKVNNTNVVTENLKYASIDNSITEKKQLKNMLEDMSKEDIIKMLLESSEIVRNELLDKGVK